jgi:hypothetical protein
MILLLKRLIKICAFNKKQPLSSNNEGDDELGEVKTTWLTYEAMTDAELDLFFPSVASKKRETFMTITFLRSFSGWYRNFTSTCVLLARWSLKESWSVGRISMIEIFSFRLQMWVIWNSPEFALLMPKCQKCKKCENVNEKAHEKARGSFVWRQCKFPKLIWKNVERNWVLLSRERRKDKSERNFFRWIPHDSFSSHL